ncbi:MAG: ABC transporter substrate-binding protein [Gammaproteobacteria bacterium]|nr:ABC transporter substrate-binding protein [Gammaproteobacteria bacterium]
MLKLALPDLVSNSYFPAIAAVELGFFAEQGLEVELEMIHPAPQCYVALREGRVDLVAGSAHLPALAFPGWQGAHLLCALSQGMYWFLVLRRDLGMRRGDLDALRDIRIVAAPGVDLGFKRLLAAAGIDPTERAIEIGPLAGGVPNGVSFGVAAAREMVAGRIDGFWANGMAAAVAVSSGAGEVVLDVRRGDGPPEAFHFTAPSLATSSRLLEESPQIARAVVRAIINTQRALKREPSLARTVGERVFPAQEAGLIQHLVERDLPFYSPALSRDFIERMLRFSMDLGLIDTPPDHRQVVALSCADLRP